MRLHILCLCLIDTPCTLWLCSVVINLWSYFVDDRLPVCVRVVPKANAFAEWSTAARQFCFSAVFFRTCSHLKVDKTRKPTLATERSSDGLTFDYDLRTRETDCYVACKFATQKKNKKRVGWRYLWLWCVTSSFSVTTVQLNVAFSLLRLYCFSSLQAKKRRIRSVAIEEAAQENGRVDVA